MRLRATDDIQQNLDGCSTERIRYQEGMNSRGRETPGALCGVNHGGTELRADRPGATRPA